MCDVIYDNAEDKFKESFMIELITSPIFNRSKPKIIIEICDTKNIMSQ